MTQEPVCARCNNYEEDCICSSGFKEPPPASLYDELKREYPGYSEGSYRAGNFLGLDFPYVPGDPGL